MAQHSLQRRASGQGTWRPVTAHTEALQIHGGSSIKAGASATVVLCSCWQGCSGAGEKQAVKRDSPSRAAGSSPDPTDGYGGAVTSRFSHKLRRAQWHTLLCKTALCPAGVLVGFGEGRSPAEGHTSQGNVACCRRRRARTDCGPWLMRGVWGFPSLGRCVAVAVLWMLAGEGGSEVNALTNTLAFEGRRCIIHCVPCACCLAESSCSCQLDWLGCPRAAAHQVEALTAGHCRPCAFSSNFANSASPPPVLTSATCTEVPSPHSLAGGDE